MNQPLGIPSASERTTPSNMATDPSANGVSADCSTKNVLIPFVAPPLDVGSSLETGGNHRTEQRNDSADRSSLTTAPTRKSKSSRGPRSSSLPEERLQRCRERNRIHARKTRLRKKEHMQSLQQKSDALKQQQLRLKQTINEKNTASILLGFAGSHSGGSSSAEDPRVEELLRRSPDDIPSSSQISELPALILPGQHASKKAKAESDALVKKVQDELPSEGFDLELLAKDRSKCTPEELDQIRRERNRMHAKRTRDRKRLFMEEMGEICRQLEEENDLLRAHLKSIDPDYFDEEASSDVSLSSTPIAPAAVKKQGSTTLAAKRTSEGVSSSPSMAPASKRVKLGNGNQLHYLLEAAGVTSSASIQDPPTTASGGDSAASALLTIVQAITTEGSPTSSPKRRRQQQAALGAAAVVGC